MHIVRSILHRARARQRTRGQSLVEFAMVLPVFLLFFGAVLDLGRIAAAQVTVANAAREGAFQAAQKPSSFQAGQPCDTNANLVVCRVLLESKDSFVTIAPADISLSCDPDCTSALGNRVTVRVVGHFQLLTPILSAFFGGTQNVTFAAESTHQLEVLPTALPSPVIPTATPSESPSASPSGSTSASPSPSSIICIEPSAGFEYSASPKSMHTPVTVTFTDTSTAPNCGIDSWLWTFRDPNGVTWTSSQSNPPVQNFSVVGVYQVELVVGNAAGHSTTGVVNIRVKS